MTEHEWLSCSGPERMLVFLHQQGSLSSRKARLFAVAVCRRIWPLLPNDQSRIGIDVAEAYADGRASIEEMAAARTRGVSDQTRALLREDPLDAAIVTSRAVTWAVIGTPSFRKDRLAEQSLHADVLRGLFSPFLTVPFDPRWRTPAVRLLAEAADDDRDLPSGHLKVTRLRDLAAALEAEGCEDAVLLDHLLSEGPH